MIPASARRADSFTNTKNIRRRKPKRISSRMAAKVPAALWIRSRESESTM
ncbi:hypothetical protein BH18THE2_BH18THE2_42600 [soil metagenome]